MPERNYLLGVGVDMAEGTSPSSWANWPTLSRDRDSSIGLSVRPDGVFPLWEVSGAIGSTTIEGRAGDGLSPVSAPEGSGPKNSSSACPHRTEFGQLGDVVSDAEVGPFVGTELDGPCRHLGQCG
jgi:hypothetical protein